MPQQNSSYCYSFLRRSMCRADREKLTWAICDATDPKYAFRVSWFQETVLRVMTRTAGTSFFLIFLNPFLPAVPLPLCFGSPQRFPPCVPRSRTDLRRRRAWFSPLISLCVAERTGDPSCTYH